MIVNYFLLYLTTYNIKFNDWAKLFTLLITILYIPIIFGNLFNLGSEIQSPIVLYQLNNFSSGSGDTVELNQNYLSYIVIIQSCINMAILTYYIIYSCLRLCFTKKNIKPESEKLINF